MKHSRWGFPGHTGFVTLLAHRCPHHRLPLGLCYFVLAHIKGFGDSNLVDRSFIIISTFLSCRRAHIETAGRNPNEFHFWPIPLALRRAFTTGR
jgi:hypothetical protein